VKLWCRECGRGNPVASGEKKSRSIQSPKDESRSEAGGLIQQRSKTADNYYPLEGSTWHGSERRGEGKTNADCGP